MPVFKNLLLIQNPTSGIAWLKFRSKRFTEKLKKCFPSLKEVLTKGPGEATSLAQEAQVKGADLVIVAGGDGTINEVINGLVGSSTVLGILPFGTGNSLAREVGLSLRPIQALEALRHGKIHDAYLGQADGRHFGLMVGVGFDADAVGHVPYKMKRVFGRWSYVFSGLRSLFCYPFPYFNIRVDSKLFKATTVVVCKASYYASSFKVSPQASLKDPVLWVCVFMGKGFWRYLLYCIAILFNFHTRLNDVVLMSAQNVSIETVPGLSAQMDGEFLHTVPSNINLAREKIKVLFAPSI